jgi:hypothetical protein
VVVPAGATSFTFPINTRYVTAAVRAMVVATYAEAQSAVAFGVLPPTVAALTLEPAAAIGGAPVTGRVTLTIPAPAEGTMVTLAGGPRDSISLPAQLLVPAGATTASFPVVTRPVERTTPASISATAGDQTTLAGLTLYPQVAHLARLEASPNPIARGLKATGTITLDAPAPATGLTVTLTSSMPGVAGVPASVQVPAGATAARFPITTTLVRAPTTVKLTAAAEGESREVTLTVLMAGISALRLTAATVMGGRSVMGVITLANPAPAGGAVIPLATDQPGVLALPVAVTVPAAAQSASFLIQTRPVSGPVTASIMATYAGETKSVRLTVRRR